MLFPLKSEIGFKSVTFRKANPVLWMRPRGAGASSPRKNYGKHRPAEPVLSYNGTGENGGRMFLSCSPFSAGPQDGKNPACQGFKGGDFFCGAPAAEKILPGP